MTDSPINFDRHLSFLLADCHRLFATALDRRLRQAKLGLSRSQWRVIGYLSRTDGITQTCLAELLDMERAPLGTLIDKLESAGLVERRADPKDRRVNRVFITRLALDILPTIRKEAEVINDEFTQGLSAEQLNSLIDSLQILKGNLLTQRGSVKATQGREPSPPQ